LTYHGFITEGKLAAIFIKPSLGVSNWPVIYFINYKPTSSLALFNTAPPDLNNLGYRDEPFVLANDMAQVFYVKDMSSKPKNRKYKATNTSYDEPKRHIVLSGKRNIMGVEDKTDMSEDYNKFDEILPFRVNIDPSITLNGEDAPWLRSKRS
jgi:hypothetical protein